MAARCLSFQQREEICAHSASHPEMTQLAVAAWAKQVFALPAAPSQSFISTLLRRSRDDSGDNPVRFRPLPVRPIPTAKLKQPATTAPPPSTATAEALSLQLEAARRASRPLLSDEMMRWVLTCDQPIATQAVNSSTQSVKTETNAASLANGDSLPLSSRSDGNKSNARAPRPNDFVAVRYWYPDEYEDPYESEDDSSWSGEGSGPVEREIAREERRERWERWHELRERRHEIVGSKADEIECESEFDSQNSYMSSSRYVGLYLDEDSARAEREYEERYDSGEYTNDDNDELETNEDGETGDEDAEMGLYGISPLEQRSPNDSLMVKLRGVLKHERDWAAHPSLVTTPTQSAHVSRFQQPLASPAVGVSTTRVKLENSSQPLASSAFAAAPMRVKPEANDNSRMLNSFSQTVGPANKLAALNRDAARRLEALQTENSLKRARAAEEHVLAHKRLREAGGSQPEIVKLLVPAVTVPVRQLLAKPATTA